MEYTIHKLAQLAGVTTRTLRYYDEIGLLSPARISSNGYRVYGRREVDRLQQILLYRALAMPLDEIGRLMSSQSYDSLQALEGHLKSLQARHRQLETLIETVQQTIAAAKGENSMSDSEKFAGLKQQLIADNEAKYGEETRARYGDELVARSNAAFGSLTQAQFSEMESLSQRLAAALRAAVANGEPASAEGQAVAALHKEWLEIAWPAYSKEAHVGVAQLYVDDARFAAYYDAIAPGAATYLRDAILVFCQ